MIHTDRQNGTVFTALLLVTLVVLSCSKGYNKYADEYYAQGKIFYQNMDYNRSIDSFSKVLELAPRENKFRQTCLDCWLHRYQDCFCG